MSKLFDLLYSVIDKVNISVKAEPQSFSEEQKQVLRDNIGALSKDEGAVEQVQADWNQNDAGAPDYIRNKPFTDNSYTSDDPNALYFTCSGATPITGAVTGNSLWDTVIADRYLVTFDEEVYEVVPTGKKEPGGAPVYLGDELHQQYPFYIYFHTYNMYDYYEYSVDSNMPGDHTVTVQPLVSDIKTLDLKFLPEVRSDWDDNNPSSPNYVRNRTHYDDSESTLLFSEIHVSPNFEESVDKPVSGGYVNNAGEELMLTLTVGDVTNTYTLRSSLLKNVTPARTFIEVEDICTILLPNYNYSNCVITNHSQSEIIVSLDYIWQPVHKLDNKFINCTDVAEKYNLAPISSHGVHRLILDSRPNWHVASKSDIKYIGGRPFYDSSNFRLLLDTTEFSGSLLHFLSKEQQAGGVSRFLILLDGIEYVVDCELQYGMSFNTVCDFDEYPFKLTTYDLEHIEVAVQDDATHTICILGASAIGDVVTLPERYIPDTVARVADIPITDSEIDELSSLLQ